MKGISSRLSALGRWCTAPPHASSTWKPTVPVVTEESTSSVTVAAFKRPQLRPLKLGCTTSAYTICDHVSYPVDRSGASTGLATSCSVPWKLPECGVHWLEAATARSSLEW